jgi:exopolysaccharide production protein ExoQ
MLHNRINRVLPAFEALFCVHAFLFYTGFWWAVIGENIPFLITAIRYSILIVPLIFLLLRWKTFLHILPKGRFLWIFIGICVLSFFWSDYPGLTLQGIIRALFQISIFGLYFSSRFNPKHQLYIIAAAMGITVVTNLFYVLALPTVGRHVNDKFSGAWRGFYSNKNEFSGAMLWSLVVFYLLSFRASSFTITTIARIGLLLCPVLVILSTSKTALVLFIFLYFALSVWHSYRWKGGQTILMIDLALLASLFLIGSIIDHWTGIVSSLGKDPSMSGRTDIWIATLFQISQKPWFGHGYSGFWTEANPAAQGIGDSLFEGFYTYNAHNGFLDILLDLGWLGLLLFMVGFLSTWALALKYAYRPRASESSWPLAVMLLVTFYNLTESSLMKDSINWVFYVCVYLSVRIWPDRPIKAAS